MHRALLLLFTPALRCRRAVIAMDAHGVATRGQEHGSCRAARCLRRRAGVRVPGAVHHLQVHAQPALVCILFIHFVHQPGLTSGPLKCTLRGWLLW